MGYHTRKIEKGVVGEFSKVQEEWEELIDARLQTNKIMELIEISDLLGAIDLYVKEHYGMTMSDLLKMTAATQRAFEEGERK